jgi:uncharacterized membrane protein YhaH (DUF805 family)
MPFTEAMFVFNGRVARLPYFGYSVLVTVLVFVLIFGGMLGFNSGGAGPLLGGALFLAGIVGGVWSSLALMVKRLHDLGLSGGNAVWIVGLNVVGSMAGQASDGLAIAFDLAAAGVGLWLLFARGQPHVNEYGPAPGLLTTSAAAPTVAA